MYITRSFKRYFNEGTSRLFYIFSGMKNEGDLSQVVKPMTGASYSKFKGGFVTYLLTVSIAVNVLIAVCMYCNPLDILWSLHNKITMFSDWMGWNDIGQVLVRVCQNGKNTWNRNFTPFAYIHNTCHSSWHKKIGWRERSCVTLLSRLWTINHDQLLIYP